MPSNGYKRRILRSKCCDKRLSVSIYGIREYNILVGVCQGCDEIVMRVDPQTMRQYWLEPGQDPLTSEQLQPVSD